MFQSLAHLEAIRTDLIENVALFVVKGEDDEGPQLQDQLEHPFDRYAVNVLVGQQREPVVPIVEELHPPSAIWAASDIVSHHGVLVTDFRLIKAGAMHAPTGGSCSRMRATCSREPSARRR